MKTMANATDSSQDHSTTGENARLTALAFVVAHGGRLHALLAKLTPNRDAADDSLQVLFLRELKSTAVLNALVRKRTFSFGREPCVRLAKMNESIT